MVLFYYRIVGMKILPQTWRIYFCFPLWIAIVTMGVAQSSLAARSTPAGDITFLIQEINGRVTGITLSADYIPSPTVTVRPAVEMMEPVIDLEVGIDGGYQLLANGIVFPIGNAKLPYAVWASIPNVSSFAMAAGSPGGWIASGPYLKTIGRPPQLVFPSFEANGFITDIEFDPKGQQLAVLNANGTISVCQRTKYVLYASPTLDEGDRAMDLEISPDSFFVLTQEGKIYRCSSSSVSEYPSVPDLTDGLAVDIELSPYNETGLYILDAFGIIHACGDTPRIDMKPLNKPSAVDLEIRSGTAPEWYPPGRYTAVRLEPALLRIDPAGPAKFFSIEIEKAEQLTSFVTQIRYDPAVLSINPGGSGTWWGESILGVKIPPDQKTKKTSLALQASRAYVPFEGLSGSGELARLTASPVSNVTSATSTIELLDFYFRDASHINMEHTGRIIHSCTVIIQPIQPQVDFSWYRSGQELKSIKPGEIVRADILIENGSRLSELSFDFTFPAETLKFLGMTPGPVWHPDSRIVPHFGVPDLANADGGLTGQRIESRQPGGCKDERDAIVILYFSVLAQGKGGIQLTKIQATDDNGHDLNIQHGNNFLAISCP